jgi:hypothetical protein
MRLDHDHIRTLARAFETDENGGRFFSVNIPVMMEAMRRLSLWERGLVVGQLMKAAAAKRPTKDQRALLALFAHRSEEDGQ